MDAGGGVPRCPCASGEILIRWTAPVSHTFDVCNRTDLLKWHLGSIIIRQHAQPS